MHTMARSGLLALAAWLAAPAAAQDVASHAVPIPTSAFASRSEFGGLLELSPDGQRVAVSFVKDGKAWVGVVNLDDGRIERRVPIPDAADAVAVIGENRKMLVFPLSELPELGRGQGVTLQRYRDGGLSDAIAFRLADGLSWALGGESGRVRTEIDLSPWRAARGAAGRMPPIGFPRTNHFA